MIPHLIFCPGPGQTIPIANGKGAAATPDYKALYFELFRANEQAIRLLTAAQQKAEAQVMEEDREPLACARPACPQCQRLPLWGSWQRQRR